MTVFAYKLPAFCLNGWVDIEQAKTDVANTYDVEDEIWAEEMEALLWTATSMVLDMGWSGSMTLGEGDAFFAPLPVAAAHAPCPCMVALPAGDATYVISPYELPWLAAGALDQRRSEMMDEPPSTARN